MSFSKEEPFSKSAFEEDNQSQLDAIRLVRYRTMTYPMQTRGIIIDYLTGMGKEWRRGKVGGRKITGTLGLSSH